MNYYVVSDEELERLSVASWQGAMSWWNVPGVHRPDALETKELAEAACRARPVDADELYTLRAEHIKLEREREKLLDVVDAAHSIRRREEIGGYGHGGIPELLDALAELDNGQ